MPTARPPPREADLLRVERFILVRLGAEGARAIPVVEDPRSTAMRWANTLQYGTSRPPR